MARSYLVSMACGALAATAIVAGVNWVVDPLQIYHSPRIEGFNALKPALKARSRVFKTVTVANAGLEALIVGTSRAEVGLDPRHPFFAGLRCFNAGSGGEDYRESLALVRAARRAGKLRKVVAVLDFEVGNAWYEGAPDYIAANYRPWRKESLAMSLDVLGEALRTPLRQDRDELLRDQSLWLADGRYIFPPPAGGHRAIALVSESEYLASNYFRGPRLQYAIATSSSQPLERIRSLIALAHENAIELTLVVAPSHARQLETIAAAGLWNDWEAWKRMLVSIDDEEARRSGRRSFPIWDFSGYNEVTTETFPALDDRKAMRWHFDSSHFTPAAGDRVLDRISGNADTAFGVLLTAANIDSQLAQARAAREQWRKAHPQDVEEIELLARDAASLRRSRQLQR
jgi:hypothetical protein